MITTALILIVINWLIRLVSRLITLNKDVLDRLIFETFTHSVYFIIGVYHSAHSVFTLTNPFKIEMDRAYQEYLSWFIGCMIGYATIITLISLLVLNLIQG